jgi:hypothetical protein
LKKVFLRVLMLVFILTGIVLAMVAPIDRTAYQNQPYYAQSLRALDSLEQELPPATGDTLKAGWSRKNITPREPLKLMGYGWKGDYQAVHDSLMLRCFVFDDGQQAIALLSYDLMIVHPDLSAAIRHAVDSARLPIDGLYFSAVHTHKGYGEWAKGLGGKLTAGGYNQELVSFIIRQSLSAIQEAYNSRRQVKTGYAEYSRPEMVRNRLTRSVADDDLLRVLKLEHDNGSTALLCTFAAHATFISSRSLELSADYPASLVQRLEQHPKVDFAAFAAGAVGSHSAVREGDFSYQKMDTYATQLVGPLLLQVEEIETNYSQKMQFTALPLALGASQLKISANWRVRPWLFSAVFGDFQPEITCLRLGETVLLGVPADYSGMLYRQLSAENINLMVTSFNGSYIGYIIPDQHYDLPHQEARELNWFGPYTGSYVTEMMNRLLDLIVNRA